MTLPRYAAALIQFAIVLVGALAAIRGHVTLVDGLQLIPLAVNAAGVYFLPLLGAADRSGWKVGLAVVGALATAGVPFATVGHITGPQVGIVVLAGLQALGAHIGVQIRRDAAEVLPASWTVPAVLEGTSGAGVALPPVAGEEPTHTTVLKAIDTSGGEFLGDAAR